MLIFFPQCQIEARNDLRVELTVTPLYPVCVFAGCRGNPSASSRKAPSQSRVPLPSVES